MLELAVAFFQLAGNGQDIRRFNDEISPDSEVIVLKFKNQTKFRASFQRKLIRNLVIILGV